MVFKGQIISEGLAYGKVKFLKEIKNDILGRNKDVDEISKFNNAIESVTKKLDNQINITQSEKNITISDIFLSHKFIVNDPLVLEETKVLISEGKTAFEAYASVIRKVINKFEKIDNQYMLGRIVDIIDASDRVKSELEIKEISYDLTFEEPTILVVDELKPSLIYDLKKKNLKGFVTRKGFFDQHSGIIARTFKIPGIAYDNIYDIATNDDYVLIDCYKGTITKNPKKYEINNMEENK